MTSIIKTIRNHMKINDWKEIVPGTCALLPAVLRPFGNAPLTERSIRL